MHRIESFCSIFLECDRQQINMKCCNSAPDVHCPATQSVTLHCELIAAELRVSMAPHVRLQNFVKCTYEKGYERVTNSFVNICKLFVTLS